MTLRSEKVTFSQVDKLRNEKYPSKKLYHLSMMSAFIWASNMGMSMLTCTLKGVAPPEWLLDEDASSVGSHRRI